ncbi:MAG TPA: alanine:cation symporter family protein, partial [Chlamydiales bacterium]|nr:alanine:cation symporter family protein [Chlamydiales bacterium]
AIPKIYVALFFLVLVLIAELGGVKRIGAISSTMIPLFIVVYLSMGFYVVALNLNVIPQVIYDVFATAFTPAAPIGAFAGASIMMAMSQGIKRACYSCDVGVGYASIIHSESSEKSAARQASLTIFEVFLDTFVICTMSIIIVIVTGTWTQPIDSIYLVQNALAKYFPYMNVFMPIMLFMLGYSTIITYFTAGMKTASFLSPKHGRTIYYIYSIVALVTFSFIDTTAANTVMSLVLAMLLLLNISAIIALRRDLNFDFAEKQVSVASSDAILAE